MEPNTKDGTISMLIAAFMIIAVVLLYYNLLYYQEIAPVMREVQALWENGTFNCCQVCDILKDGGILR